MIKRKYLLFIVLALISVGWYLVQSSRVYGIGYPLDDAWIHQTYARNLVEQGEWAFVPGTPSAGSTAPLWSGLLALGYLLNINHLYWTFGLGVLTLGSLGYLGYVWIRTRFPDKKGWALLGGGILVFEWHLVWAAVSGMETLLFGLLVLWFSYSLVTLRVRWFWLGLMVGVSVWIRPDGLTLLGPLMVCAAIRADSKRGGTITLGKILLGFLVLFIPYLMMNYFLSGEWWPNTFYAKQAEYAILREVPFLKRYITQFSLPLVGGGIMLVPGLLIFGIKNWKLQKWEEFIVLLWYLGYLGIYAWRLPVTYQHGRYLIPAMPVIFMVSFSGIVWMRPARLRWRRILGEVWRLAFVVVLSGFWWRGAQAYAIDVAIIETEMVATANWIAKNTSSQDFIAAHDIGALGYFAKKELIDLAGLISPAVIPIIRDESKLAEYLDAQGAGYLVTFQGWYPQLEEKATLVFETKGPFSIDAGGTNMGVYRWHTP